MDGTGVTHMAMLPGLFFSGMLLPLNVFPGPLGDVVRALPWSALLQMPADVLLGRHRLGRGRVRLPARLGGGAARRRAAAAVGGDAEGGGAGWLRCAGTAARARRGRRARGPGRGGGLRGGRAGPGAGLGGCGAYRLIGGMWIRSTMAYRASFVMTPFGNFAVTALDFVAILLMFSQVRRARRLLAARSGLPVRDVEDGLRPRRLW